MIHSGFVLNTLVCTALWTVPTVKSNGDSNGGTEKMGCIDMAKNLFDFSIIRNRVFLTYMAGELLIRFNVFVFYDQTISRAVFYGYDLQQASILITILCLASLISRTTISIILRFHEINPLALATTLGYIQCSMSFLVAMSTNYKVMVLCTIIYGFAQGIYL